MPNIEANRQIRVKVRERIGEFRKRHWKNIATDLRWVIDSRLSEMETTVSIDVARVARAVRETTK